jgi:hypothetical protein
MNEPQLLNELLVHLKVSMRKPSAGTDCPPNPSSLDKRGLAIAEVHSRFGGLKITVRGLAASQ